MAESRLGRFFRGLLRRDNSDTGAATLAPPPARPASDAGDRSDIRHGTRFGFDAVENGGGKRRPATGFVRSEDAELTTAQRRELVSQSRDVHRNFTVAGWMIRKHLDYVSTYNFQAKTPDATLNRKIEAKIAEWGRRENCDVGRRHSFAQMIRLLEARAVVDGDCGLIKLADGRLQPMEGDRIATPHGGAPAGIDPAQLVRGVILDAWSAATAYVICNRPLASDFAPNTTSLQFQAVVPARHMALHAYFERFDQVRGISPLAPAINGLIDSYEGIDYALARLKVEQLFGLALYRDAPEGALEGQATDYTQISLGKRPFILNLDPGDKAEFLSSSNPSSNFQAFLQLLIMLSLKALDIPYSFFAEDFTNYSGSRQALLQYEQSCTIKRRNLQALLRDVTDWRLGLMIADGELPAHELAYEWIPAGMPWIDPVKEGQGNIAALSAGLTTRTAILKEQGRDFYEVADTLKRENEYLEGLGLPTNTTPDNALLRDLVTNAAP